MNKNITPNEFQCILSAARQYKIFCTERLAWHKNMKSINEEHYNAMKRMYENDIRHCDAIIAKLTERGYE